MTDNESVGTYRPPSESQGHLTDTTDLDELERRVCPNCRLFFDVGEETDIVFCGEACRRRHEQGEWL